MSQNISIHLPDDTLVEIDKLSPQGDLSLFIGEAIQFYIHEAKKKALRDLIEEGSIVRVERDLALAQEWFALEEENRYSNVDRQNTMISTDSLA